MSREITIQSALKEFSGLSKEAFSLSENLWKPVTFSKGDFYNNHKSICKNLGFILEGTFRSYIIDGKTGEEKNMFFYTKNGFVVTFKSFIEQTPCNYYTQAVTDSKILWISIYDLKALYRQSHEWERFGRLLAQIAFNEVIDRLEDIVMKSAEERYLNLVNKHPDICESIPLYHIASYLGIQGPSLSRIRKRISKK